MSATVKAASKPLAALDERLTISTWFKSNLRKVFPDHWSFLLGEIALYSFIVLLLSGTPQFIADGIAAQLGVTECIGSLGATRGVSFDWRVPLRHPFGTAKLALATDYCRRAGIAATDVFAYGDSRYDLPLLYWCGHPVAVQPDRELAQVARERNWELLDRRGTGARGSNSLTRPG